MHQQALFTKNDTTISSPFTPPPKTAFGAFYVFHEGLAMYRIRNRIGDVKRHEFRKETKEELQMDIRPRYI